MNPGRGVERLMFRGMGGDLIRGPGFAHLRATQADIFVCFSYAAVFVVSIILILTTSSFALTLILYGLWTLLGYVFIALGTKLAHNFATWGIALVATLMSLGGVWGSIARLSTDRVAERWTGEHIESPVVLALQLLIFVALVAGYGYLTVVMGRFVGRMSSTVAFAPAAPGSPYFPPPGPQQHHMQAPPPSFSPPQTPQPPASPRGDLAPPSLVKSSPPQSPPAVDPAPQVASQSHGADAPTRTMVVPPLPQPGAPTRAGGPPRAESASPGQPAQYNPPGPPSVPFQPTPLPPTPLAPTWPSQPPSGWQQQPPLSTAPSNGFLGAIASAAFVIPAVGAYWLYNYSSDHLAGTAHDVFGPLLWSLPAVVLVIAVLIRARSGRRLAATLIAVLTLAITIGLNYLVSTADLSSAGYDVWLYTMAVVPPVGAVTAWGIARRRGALWLLAVPLSAGASALWTWIVYVQDEGNDWAYPMLRHWWGFAISDLWPVIMGILLAWILDASTRPRPGATFQPGGHLPPPQNHSGPVQFAGSGPIGAGGSQYPQAPPAEGSNPLAITALFSSFVFAPLGVLFGHLAIHQIARTGQRGRGLAVGGLVIGYTFTAIAVATWIILIAAFNSTNDSIASADYEAPTSTTMAYTPPPTTTVGTTGVIRNAAVGDCLHIEYLGTTNADGSRALKATTATCSSSYATNKVSGITDDPSTCPDVWIRTGSGSPVVVLCLLDGAW
ncbi:DUF4190 domain-containing protein [Williamsia sp. 1135]|uniref:DUF4190 domain-containing protein n=1 Tax=Williamsia sp. 1135 TaxID=1889262 RepID=UPI000A0FA65A|nr:DUF4190 domain-containing protein [Williamsia sp. 1135]ORM37147.1 hypothetical protein BFL43_05130 [Williamsia sp. 1135]